MKDESNQKMKRTLSANYIHTTRDGAVSPKHKLLQHKSIQITVARALPPWNDKMKFFTYLSSMSNTKKQEAIKLEILLSHENLILENSKVPANELIIYFLDI